MILRPLTIYLNHVFVVDNSSTQESVSDFAVLALLQFMNLVNVLMFFYLIFKMKVIQILLSANMENLSENVQIMIKDQMQLKILKYKRFLCVCVFLLILMTLSSIMRIPLLMNQYGTSAKVNSIIQMTLNVINAGIFIYMIKYFYDTAMAFVHILAQHENISIKKAKIIFMSFALFLMIDNFDIRIISPLYYLDFEFFNE